MTDEGRRDSVVRGWILAEAPGHAPARLRETIRDQISDTRQERVILPFRMRRLQAIGYAAAAAALLAIGIAFGGLIGTPRPSNSPSPVPSASASAGPSARPVPTPRGPVLPAGVFDGAQLMPAIVLTLPAGWTLEHDARDATSLVRPGAGHLVQGDGVAYFDGIKLYARPIAGQPDGVLGGVPGVGTSARDLSTWLSKRPQLVSTAVTEDSLAGLPAFVLDFELSASAGGLCGMPCANLLDDGPDQAEYAFGIQGPWKVRAYFVDAPDGSTVMITIEDTDGIGFDDEVAAAEPILATLRFVAAGESPLPS
jgi:hypothetical protein